MLPPGQEVTVSERASERASNRWPQTQSHSCGIPSCSEETKIGVKLTDGH